jgi:hypothetical protein
MFYEALKMADQTKTRLQMKHHIPEDGILQSQN